VRLLGSNNDDLLVEPSENRIQSLFICGEGSKGTGTTESRGASGGSLGVEPATMFNPSCRVTAATWDGGLGDGSAQVPPVKREAPLRQLPFENYCAIASVCASVKKKAFVRNIRSCSCSSSFFGFLVVCFQI